MGGLADRSCEQEGISELMNKISVSMLMSLVECSGYSPKICLSHALAPLADWSKGSGLRRGANLSLSYEVITKHNNSGHPWCWGASGLQSPFSSFCFVPACDWFAKTRISRTGL
jgi:hypothetical protein